MKILALDLSTSTGYAVLETEGVLPLSFDQKPQLVEYGRVGALPLDVETGCYPWSMLERCRDLGERLGLLVKQVQPNIVVIEETNLGRNRYSQKQLEWIHYQVLNSIRSFECAVFYVNTSDWRRKLGTTLTKEDKKLNAKVRKLKKSGDKEGLRKLGVRGKIGKKHVAIRFVNAYYNLQLRMKDNDVADAICIGSAYLLGVATCDGK